MSVVNLFQIAFRSLSKNKLRSFLTMLGIIIGVGSVVAMISIGQGSQDSIEAQISGLGTNVIMVMPGTTSQGGVRTDAGSSQRLKQEDADAIAKQCPSVQYVSPIVRVGCQLIAGSQNWRSSINGVYLDYFPIRNLTVEQGMIFSQHDDQTAAKVCLIGHTVVKNLFGEGVNPVGITIRINNTPFKIIGVLEKKGQNAMGMDQDDIVLAPFNTVQRRMMATTYINIIFVSAKSHELIEAASDEITKLVSIRHKIEKGDEPDFSIRTQSDIENMFNTTSKILTVLLASIASISLLVGGIGIMNIMYVSVTERTREIGIRLAVGAKASDVLMQFLIEAVLLSFIGGLIGIVLGLGLSNFVSSMMGWPVTISLNSIVISFLFSAATGIFFGWYPARKASNLNPIEALRYE